MAWNPNIPTVTNRVQDDLNAIRENFQVLDAHLADTNNPHNVQAVQVPYSSGVAGFSPADVKVALDALAGVRIVEMGSNSNGWYVRWENGLQVCWNAINVGPANAFGSGTLDDMYRSASLQPSFPAQFQTPPYVVPFAYRPGSTLGARPVGASYSGVSTSMVDALQAWSFSSDSSDVILGYLAIGRWK